MFNFLLSRTGRTYDCFTFYKREKKGYNGNETNNQPSGVLDKNKFYRSHILSESCMQWNIKDGDFLNQKIERTIDAYNHVEMDTSNIQNKLSFCFYSICGDLTKRWNTSLIRIIIVRDYHQLNKSPFYTTKANDLVLHLAKIITTHAPSSPSAPLIPFEKPSLCPSRHIPV